MVKHIEHFAKADSGYGEIYNQLWIPDGEVKAVLVLVHGIAEHSTRFKMFAEYLAQRGVVVAAQDLAGHGKSTQDAGDLGPDNAWIHVVNDVKKMIDKMYSEYKGVPVFVLGNSLGTAITREYIRVYGKADGVILVGTMERNSSLAMAANLAKIITVFRGKSYRSTLLQAMSFATFLRKYEDKDSKSAQMNDLKNVIDQVSNKRIVIGEPFTAESYYQMFNGIANSVKKSWAKEAVEMPYLIASGQKDPIGFFGISVKMLVDELKASGKTDVTGKLFPGLMHEVLQDRVNHKLGEKDRANDPVAADDASDVANVGADSKKKVGSSAQEVWEYIYKWIESHTK
jgi:alpha-beta hydrolase superfamily lysophospholipase